MKKECTKCKQEKDLTEFYKRKDARDGLRADCKKCFLLNQKAYYKVNPDKKKAKDQAYYRSNDCRIKKRNNDWKRENKENHLTYNNKWRKANIDRVNAQSRERDAYKKEEREMQEEAGFEQC